MNFMVIFIYNILLRVIKESFPECIFLQSRVKWKLLTMNSGLENWFFTSCFGMGN